MSEPSTFIKLDRNILRWEWYKDSTTKSVFLHLLLTANIKDGTYQGVHIKRGEVPTSYPQLSEALKISIRQARTSISRLQTTGSVTVRRYPRFSVVSIVSYDRYQGERQGKRQRNDSETTASASPKRQSIHIKELKKERIKEEEAAAPHVSPLGDSGAKVPTVTAPVVLPEGRDEYGFRWA